MPRVNPQVEQLQRENAILRRMLDERSKDPGDLPVRGCGDSSCIVQQTRSGMHTNGGCRCDERRLRQAMQYWRRRSEFLEETIRILREPAGE